MTARVIVRYVKRARGWIRIEIPNDPKNKPMTTWSREKPEESK